MISEALGNGLAGAAALICAAMGLAALIRPSLAARIVRLTADPARPGGAAEFRATFGGIFFGLGAAVLASLYAGNGIIGSSFAASAAFLFAAIGRGIAMAADRAATPWNVFSIVFELALAVLFFGPFLAHIRA